MRSGSPEITGYVGKGMYVEGKMEFEGAARIDGHLKGEINSDGTLFVGEGALIEGQVNVYTVIVSGEIKGLVWAKNRVELKQPGRVYGDIKTPNLIIGEGVIFEGKCIMSDSDRPIEFPSVEKAGG